MQKQLLLFQLVLILNVGCGASYMQGSHSSSSQQTNSFPPAKNYWTSSITQDPTLHSNASTTDLNTTDLNTTACEVVYSTSVNSSKRGVLAVFICIVAFVICFGNCLVISVFTRVRGFRTMTNYFICQLAIADLLVGLVMPFYATVMVYEPLSYSVHACTFRYSFFVLSAAGSVSSLLALAYDRNLAICKPLKYKAMMGKKHFIKQSLLVWTLPVLCGFVGTLIFHRSWSEDCPEKCDYYTIMPMWYIQIIVVPYLITCITLLTIITLISYYKVRKHFRSYNLVAASAGLTTNGGIKEKDVKLLKITILVLGVFYISWIPYVTIMSLIAYGGMLNNPTLYKTRYIMTLLFVCNSAVNPIIYGLSLPSYRNEFGKILKIKTCTKDSDDSIRDTSSSNVI